MNALRGLLYEFGVVLPQGRHAGLKALREQRARIDAQLPQPMQRLVDLQLQALHEVEQHIVQFEAQIAAQHKQLHNSARLDRVPGIGLLGATALAATLGDGSGWRSGREFSACLGLVPEHSGTGGKTRVGHLSKRGDGYLRTLLIHGARSVITHSKQKPKWLEQIRPASPRLRGFEGINQLAEQHEGEFVQADICKHQILPGAVRLFLNLGSERIAQFSQGLEGRQLLNKPSFWFFFQK